MAGLLLVNAVALIISFCAVLVNRKSVQQQRQTTDLSNYLKLVEMRGDSWRRLKQASAQTDGGDDSAEYFEFIEALSLIEGICHLYNQGILYGATLDMTQDYLEHILRDISTNNRYHERLSQSITDPSTYEEIRIFSKKHKMTNVGEFFSVGNHASESTKRLN